MNVQTAACPALLVALDIDGTLLRADRTVSAETRRAVARALAAGHHLVPATGRSLAGVTAVAADLGLERGYAVCSNGAITVRLDPDAPGGYRFVDVALFDPGAVIRRAVEVARDVRVGVEEPGWGWRVDRPFPPHLLNGQQRTTSAGELCENPATRVVLHAPQVRRHLAALRSTGMTVTPAGSDWLDVTGPGVSKATALEALRVRLGVPYEGTVAVGDGINDVEALVWAARGVAMGHALAVVRAVADEVTGTIDEHGAATVLGSLARPTEWI